MYLINPFFVFWSKWPKTKKSAVIFMLLNFSPYPPCPPCLRLVNKHSKENHETKVTKLPKTKRRKYEMNGTIAEVFYGANYQSTIITSKNTSKNLSFCCFQDKKCIKMPSLFTLLRFFDELFDVITFWRCKKLLLLLSHLQNVFSRNEKVSELKIQKIFLLRKAIETGMILFIDRVAADFFG